MQEKKTTFISPLVNFIKRKTSPSFKFNEQFENGEWEGLKGIAELARYSIITGYVQFYFPAARIVDLGCGEGVLQQRLTTNGYTTYLGVDFSDVAIGKVKELENANTSFTVGDLDKLVLEGVFDVIIYNESIYYLADIPGALRALLPHLSANGYFIISVVDKHGKVQEGIWAKIREVLTPIDATQVVNRKGDSWTVQVYQK